MPHPRVTLESGYFRIDGEPFWPIGFNTWPSRSGVNCWQQFDLREWEQDFAAMVDRGYNTARLFLLWEHFQPAEDRIGEAMLDRLAQVCQAAARHGLWVVPTLFQGWMSGMNHDPSWRAGRNQIADPAMQAAMNRLATAAARALVDCPNILMIDLANEIDLCQGDVDDEAVRTWTGGLREAIRRGRPDTLVINGDGCIWVQRGWSYEACELDCFSLHGYPIFSAPLPTGRLGNTTTSQVFAPLTAWVRAYGPVMREEYGSAMGGDGPHVEGFVRAASTASYLAGANGFLYWCWRDFTNEEPPYQREPFETAMGYVDTDLEPKAWAKGYDDLRDFILANPDLRPAPADVAIYTPQSYKRGASTFLRGLPSAYLNLLANGVTPEVTCAIDDRYRLLIVPYGDLGIQEQRELEAYLDAGGRVILVNLMFRSCGHHWERVSRTRHVDVYPMPDQMELALGEQRLSIPTAAVPYPMSILEPMDDSVTVAAASGDMPHVLLTRRGQGRLVQCVLPLEQVDFPEVDETLAGVWAELLGLADYEPAIRISDRGVQATRLSDGAHRQAVMLLNHRAHPVSVEVEAFGETWSADLPAKQFALHELGPQASAEAAAAEAVNA
ncbi:MAG: cellulase family glycosylhydrolase [Phycisphaeraceae bacterium]